MVAVTSQIDANSEAFAANRASMMTFIERLRSLEARAAEASAKRRATFEKAWAAIARRSSAPATRPRYAFSPAAYAGQFRGRQPGSRSEYPWRLGAGGDWLCGRRALHDLGR
jgi:geranyl-CoA carboxylase beta subunit